MENSLRKSIYGIYQAGQRTNILVVTYFQFEMKSVRWRRFSAGPGGCLPPLNLKVDSLSHERGPGRPGKNSPGFLPAMNPAS